MIIKIIHDKQLNKHSLKFYKKLNKLELYDFVLKIRRNEFLYLK